MVVDGANRENLIPTGWTVMRSKTVSQHRRSAKILLALLIGLLPIEASARGRKYATYDGAVDFGSQFLNLESGCFAVDGSVSSGNFFEDLKRIDIGNQTEYRKEGRVLTEYPDSITTSIRIMGDECTPGFSNPTLPIFEGDSYSMTFEVQWKDGMQLTPAVLFPAIAHCVGTRIITNTSKDSTFPAVTCQMTVQSRGVPLMKHLIVSVFSPDGKRLARLSAAP
jgi:hypothetical protein